MNFLHRIFLIFSLFFHINLVSSVDILVQFPWDKIAPTAIATLSCYFAKFNMTNIDISDFKKLLKKIDQPSKSNLTKYTNQDFLLSEVYQKLFPINDLCLKSPEYWEVVNTGRMDLISFNTAMWQAYKYLKEGDFVYARKSIWPWLGTTNERYYAIERLFGAFNVVTYNDFNILKKFEKDPFWASLSKGKKLEIAHNKDLRTAMNLELSLRADLLQKLQDELGLKNLNYQGLKPFLFSLMVMRPSKKIKVLLNLKPAEKLWPAFYNKNCTLKAFNDMSFATLHRLPYIKNQFYRDFYIKRINELIYCNQGCKNNQLFIKAADAIANSAKGNIYYMHLLFSSVSPSDINDFVAEVDLIKAYLQEQKDKQNSSLDSDNQDGKGDPNDPKHQKEVMTFLLVAQKKSEDLIDAINTRLAAGGEVLRIRAINLYHTFHGHLRGTKPTGLHILWRKCCFEVQKIRYLNKNSLSFCDVVKNGIKKQRGSTMFPESWSPEKVMDKLIEWIRVGRIEKVTRHSKVKLSLLKKCCGGQVDFLLRSTSDSRYFDIDSVYPGIEGIMNNLNALSKCNCLR